MSKPLGPLAPPVPYHSVSRCGTYVASRLPATPHNIAKALDFMFQNNLGRRFMFGVVPASVPTEQVAEHLATTGGPNTTFLYTTPSGKLPRGFVPTGVVRYSVRACNGRWATGWTFSA